MSHKVTLLPGDGIGPEITTAMKTAVKATGVDIDWEEHAAGEETVATDNTPLPDRVLDSIRKNKVAKTRVTKCSWAGSDYWSSKPCGALSAWELGLVEGLNPEIKIKFLKRMSKGDDCCEAEYSIEMAD